MSSAQYIEFTPKVRMQHVAQFNGQPVVFHFVPAAVGMTQVAKVTDDAAYRWLIENDPRLRPYIAHVNAKKIIAAAEKREREEELRLAKKRREEDLQRRIKRLKWVKARLETDVDNLVKAAGAKKLQIDDLVKEIKSLEEEEKKK